MLAVLFVNLMGLLSPGPDFFFISRRAASSSLRNALLSCIGVGLGVMFWAAVATFGLTLINRLTQGLFQHIIMCLGGGFLTYMGYKMASVTTSIMLQAGNIDVKQTTAWQEIMKGLLVNLSNAKAIVFFVSVMSGVAMEMEHNDLLIAVLLLGLESMLYFMGVSLLFSRQPVRRFYSRFSRYIDNFAGVVFIFFGLSLIYETVLDLMK